MATEKKEVRFEVRITAAEALKLDAIARHLRCSKGDVLRLALSPNFGDGSSVVAEKKAERIEAGIAEISATVSALAARLESVETLVGGMVDLVLSLTKNLTPSATQDRPAHPRDARHNPTVKPAATARPGWKEYQAKNPKEYPLMTPEAWVEFLAEEYEKKFGVKPDLNS